MWVALLVPFTSHLTILLSGLPYDWPRQSVKVYRHIFMASGLRLLHRFVLASTQELHEKISELATRVRELEDALRSSHSHLTSEQHPLLTEELLKIKAPLQRDISHTKTPSSVVIKEEETNPDIVDSFGSLSISLTGRAKYFGQTANSWVSTILFFTPHLTASFFSISCK